MLVNNQISGWMGRVATKLAEMSNDLDGAQKIHGNSMLDQFRYIAEHVKTQLRQIK